MTRLSDIILFLEALGSVFIQKGTINLMQEIIGPRNADDANENQFTFFNLKHGDAVYEKIASSKAPLIILESTIDVKKCILPAASFILSSKDSKKLMIDVATHFFTFAPKSFIHSSAIISESVVIGVDSHISSGVVLEEGVEIGSNCFIEPNVYIHRETRIGDRVFIKANAVIGGNGFGYVKTDSGAYQHVPHFGRVIIEDDVDIGSNACIDRGSLSDTILKKGVKIDNLVHIAHNVQIDENSLVIANSMIAGSVQIGKNCWIAPSVSVKNGIKIGDNVVVGMSSLVLKSIESDQTVAGVPAKVLEKKS
jgi:UDP-3-O-[3-hydroxymyristoyl] glucosamine N-acyltransferase